MAGIEWNIDLSGLDRLTAEIENAAPFAVGRAAEHLRGVSVELAPIQEGDLRNSAGVNAVDHFTARVYYQSVYARYQHYGLDFRHPMGGQALYLEQPTVTEAQACTQIIADTIKEATGL